MSNTTAQLILLQQAERLLIAAGWPHVIQPALIMPITTLPLLARSPSSREPNDRIACRRPADEP